MTALPPNSQQGFVPNDLIIPDEFSEANLILTDYFRAIVDALNQKDIAQYNTVETLCGQQYFTPLDANDTRYVYRKVISFGALPNAGTTNVPHGITTTANTVFTRIYGTATDPGASTVTRALPIPYVDPGALANGILLEVGATNVTITTAANYSAFTVCNVVLEYIQN